MSRQRPYESFEKAYFMFLLNDNESRKSLDKLLLEIHGFEELNVDMRLPWTFFIGDKNSKCFRGILGLWSSMCRLYGEQYSDLTECYIPAKYISLAREWLEDHIKEAKDDILCE